MNKVKLSNDENGNIITDRNHIGIKNPYRYKGYRYDEESKLYYLNSRYYNPEWSRFINADGMIGTAGGLLTSNMFAYCGNNPVNNVDPSGYYFYGISTGTLKFTTPPPNPAPMPNLSVVNKNYIAPYPDYSSQINKVVQQNINTVKEKSPVLDIVWFYNQVKSTGPWDYKLKDQWNNGIATPFLEYDGIFIWDGVAMNAEQFGNMHYGIVGTAMGYSPFVLYSGGGVAAIGFTKYFFTAFPPYWGDAPNDHIWIKKGITYYNK